MLGRYEVIVLLLLGKGKPWKGLAINRKKAKAMAAVVSSPHALDMRLRCVDTKALLRPAPRGCWHAVGVVLLA